MKALLFVISVVLFSCNKEVVNSPIKRSPEQLKEVSISLQKVTYAVDALSYGVCTNEVVHLTGDLELTFIVRQVDNTFNITANWIYNVFGVGQITGSKYKLIGHQTSLEKWIAILP
jgi:hypothetical protein